MYEILCARSSQCSRFSMLVVSCTLYAHWCNAMILNLSISSQRHSFNLEGRADSLKKERLLKRSRIIMLVQRVAQLYSITFHLVRFKTYVYFMQYNMFEINIIRGNLLTLSHVNNINDTLHPSPNSSVQH